MHPCGTCISLWGTRCCWTRSTRPSRSLLSPQWMGPFRVLARTAPNTYRLDIPATWRVFPEFNVERLRPYLRRPVRLGGGADVGPATRMWARRRRFRADGVPEHEVQELLKFKMRHGRPYVLVRWTGRDAAADTWEPLDNLTNCEAAIIWNLGTPEFRCDFTIFFIYRNSYMNS